MPLPEPTVEELVATLKRSAIPTIIVEGDQDVETYRWIEEQIGGTKASLLPCGGRDNLLAVYQRTAEFAHLRTSFIADLDMWLFTSVPDEYARINWTSGYSLENDLYAGSGIERLLTPSEQKAFYSDLKRIAPWFAFEIEEYRNGKLAKVAAHPDVVIPKGDTGLSREFCERRGYREPAPDTVEEVLGDYRLKLRGKILIALLLRYLSAPKRRTRHGRASILEFALRGTENPFLERLLALVRSELQIVVDVEAA
jgi:hypothetical protein